MNIDAAQVKTYQTIDYVNITDALFGNDELQKMAAKYFRGMTAPSIPTETGECVYSHDWNSFLRWANWKLQNPNINNLQDVGVVKN